MGIAFFGHWLGRAASPALDSTPAPRVFGTEDAESQFKLGLGFTEGALEARNYAQAAEWYLKAAQQGHRLAQFHLGLMYGQGQGVLRSQVTAGMWLRRSAESGHPGAQYHFGVRLHRASKAGRESDASELRMESFKWLQLAAEQGGRGAESAREFVALGMTREEVSEGGRRAVGFTAERAKPASLTRG